MYMYVSCRCVNACHSFILLSTHTCTCTYTCTCTMYMYMYTAYMCFTYVVNSSFYGNVQAVTYKEDFESERKDREAVHTRIADMETRYRHQLEAMGEQLHVKTDEAQRHKEALGSTQELLQRQQQQMTAQLQQKEDELHTVYAQKQQLQVCMYMYMYMYICVHVHVYMWLCVFTLTMYICIDLYINQVETALS